MLILASLSAPRFLKQAIEIPQRRIPGRLRAFSLVVTKEWIRQLPS